MERKMSKDLIQGLFYLQKKAGYQFDNPDLLALAFTPRSAGKTHAPAANNERLEFLGDAALGLVVGRDLYSEYPDADEGFMTIERSRLVCGQNLTEWGYKAGFDRMLKSSSRDVEISASMVEDAVESAAGAFFLDGGLEAVRALVQSFPDYPDQGTGFDARRHLERNCTLLRLGSPKYSAARRRANGRQIFECEISIDGDRIGTGIGDTKEESERNAARDAMCSLNRTTNEERKKQAYILRARYRRMLSQRARKKTQAEVVTMSDATSQSFQLPKTGPVKRIAVRGRYRWRDQGNLAHGTREDPLNPFAGINLSGLKDSPKVAEILKTVMKRMELGEPDFMNLPSLSGKSALSFVQLSVKGEPAVSGSGRTAELAAADASWKMLQFLAAEPCGLLERIVPESRELASRLEAAFFDILKNNGEEPRIEFFSIGADETKALLLSGQKTLCETSAPLADQARLMVLLKAVTQMRLWKKVQSELGITLILPWEPENWRPDLALEAYSRVARSGRPEIISLAVQDAGKNTVTAYRVGLFIKGALAAYVYLPGKKLAVTWLSLIILDRAAGKRPAVSLLLEKKTPRRVRPQSKMNRESEGLSSLQPENTVSEQAQLPEQEEKASVKKQFANLIKRLADYYIS